MRYLKKKRTLVEIIDLCNRNTCREMPSILYMCCWHTHTLHLQLTDHSSPPFFSNIIPAAASIRQICLCGTLWRILHEADALKHPSYLDEIIPLPPLSLSSSSSSSWLSSSPATSGLFPRWIFTSVVMQSAPDMQQTGVFHWLCSGVTGIHGGSGFIVQEI